MSSKGFEIMTTNRDESIRWIEGAFTNFFRAVESSKQEDYPQSILLLQQSLEFAFKAVFLARGLIPQRTHDPGKLLKEFLNEEEIKEFENALDLMSDLADHYLPTRYPEVNSPFEVYDVEDWNSYSEKIVPALTSCLEDVSKFTKLARTSIIDQALEPINKDLRLKILEVLQEYELD